MGANDPGEYIAVPGIYTTGVAVSSIANRNVKAIEVLDHAKDAANAIMLYKIVSIVHEISITYDSQATESFQAVCPGDIKTTLNDKNTVVSNVQTISCTRGIEYWLWWKCGDQTSKRKLEECSFSYIGGSFSGSGKRAYGASLQVTDKFLIYHYMRESFSGSFGGWEAFRDTPPEMESRNQDKTTGDYLWTPGNTIVGAIPITDPFGSDISYFCEHSDIPPQGKRIVYSAGLAYR